ncbi:hypothetical protein FOZ63_030658, partial [Perkinsus olseni]
ENNFVLVEINRKILAEYRAVKAERDVLLSKSHNFKASPGFGYLSSKDDDIELMTLVDALPVEERTTAGEEAKAREKREWFMGVGIMIASVLFLVIGLYAVCFSEMMPYTGIRVLDWLKEDWVGPNTAPGDEKAEPRGKSDGPRSALKGAKKRAAAMPGRLVFLLLLGLSPIGIMLVFSLTRLHSLLLAMFAMHAFCMVLVPAIFIVLDRGDSSVEYRTYFFEASSRPNLLVGLLSFCTVLAVGCGLYAALRCRQSTRSLPVCIPSCLKELTFYGFDLPMPALLALGFYFGIVNPVLEEFFWRVFLYRELGQRFLPVEPSDGVARPDSEAAFLDLELNGSRLEDGSIPDGVSVSEFPGQLLISALYASYHFVIVRELLDSYTLATLALCGLVLFGRLLSYYCRHPRKFGFIAACFLHSGLDFVVDLAILWQVVEHKSSSAAAASV